MLRVDHSHAPLAAPSHDLAMALRCLRRDPRRTASVVLVLAFGVGLSHLFFTLTYAHTRRGLPIADPGRVLFVATVGTTGGERGLSAADVTAYRDAQRAFVDVAAFANAPMTLVDRERAAERFDGAFATAAGFALTGVGPRLGRTITAADDRPGAPPVVVLTERVWRLRYGRDPAVVGQRVEANGIAAEIVGVIADASGFPSPAAVFLPLQAMPGVVDDARPPRTLRVFGRLRPDVTEAAALAEAGALRAAVFAADPPDERPRLVMRPLNEQLLGPLSGWLAFILAGLLVAVVASANVGTLLLVQSVQRARELAVRVSLGASRGRLFRQLLFEGVIMAVAAGALGAWLSRAGVGVYRSWVPDGLLPYWFDYSMDRTVFLAVWTIALASVALFGVVPALRASRADVVDTLKAGGRTATARTRGWATAFLAVQLGLAVTLVAQVGVAALNTRGRELPTDAATADAHVFTASIAMPATAQASVLRRVLDAVVALPGVQGAALTSQLPLASAPTRELRVFGRGADAAAAPGVMAIDISPGYFATLGTPVGEGRDFTGADLDSAARTAIVNARLAELHFADQDPLGQRIALVGTEDSEPVWHTIVGIAPTIRQGGRPDPAAVVYLPRAGVGPGAVWLLARTAADATRLTAPVREAVRRLDPGAVVSSPRTLAQATRDLTWAGRVSERFALTVSGATFLLATVGLYAVVAHRGAERRREMSIRMAIGAGRGAITRLVAGDLGRATVAGLVLGLLGVVGWSRAFAPAGDRTAADPAVYACAALALVLAVALGAAVPLRRALRVLPGEALRDE